jgi:hypothetical protein
VLPTLAALVGLAMAVRLPCLTPSSAGAERWEERRAHLQEELRELPARVRRLFTRQGVQIPVPADLVASVECRRAETSSFLRQKEGEG